MVVEVPERMDAAGNTLIALDTAAVSAAYAYLRHKGAQAVAVSFLHAYRNSSHERLAADLSGGDLAVFASHQVVPEAREFERTSTTVIAAYLAPIVRHYLKALSKRLAAKGAPREYWVMKSSGGLFSSETAQEHPEELVESGPAAGVIGAAAAARGLGILDIISFDMGGTTAKAALIRDGVAQLNYEYEVGGAAHAGGFLQKGTGYPLRIPVIDLAEVGTGGGSIAWIDRGGALRVGPRSAGALPGPVCYRRGGTEPTVTDAELVLGYLDEAGSAQYLGRVDQCAARASIAAHIAEPLGHDGRRGRAGNIRPRQRADGGRRAFGFSGQRVRCARAHLGGGRRRRANPCLGNRQRIVDQKSAESFIPARKRPLYAQTIRFSHSLLRRAVATSTIPQ